MFDTQGSFLLIVSYVESVGACRGGASPANNAGLKFYRDRKCEDRCNLSAECAAYTLPITSDNWCETFTSLGATGNGQSKFKCYTKH